MSRLQAKLGSLIAVVRARPPVSTLQPLAAQGADAARQAHP